MIVEFKNNERSIERQEEEEVVEVESPNKNFIHSNLNLDDIPDHLNRNRSEFGTLEG